MIILYHNYALFYLFTAISLAGGKFHVLGKATVVEKKLWEKYLIPNVKSDRLIYFNSITKAVYESAFVGKQSTFQAYLEGQRIKVSICPGCNQVQTSVKGSLIVSGRDDS